MEVCATVWAYQPVYNFHIAVYDYSEDKVCTLESPGQLMYELTCRNDTLIATMKKENIGSILKMGTLALIRDNSADGYAFRITSLDDSFRDVTETITCIDLYTRKSVCLSSPEEIETMTKLLHNLQDMVVPVSASELEPVLADDFNWCFLNVNYDLGRKQLRFSTDFQYIWEEGVDGAYRIREPEALRSYVESITDGVRNRETSGVPFATMDTPWDWCAGLTSDAIASANMNVKLYTVGSSSSSTGGAISSSTLEELISVLNQIPRSAFKNEQSNTQRDYLDLTNTVGQTGVSVTLMDTVNQILVAIRTNGSRIEFLATNDLEKTEDRFRGYFFESLKMWTVDDSRLAELLTAYFENPPVITYTVGAEYDWQPPVQFGAEDFSLSLRLVEGWEFEEYSDRRSSGIRCRPAGAEEGWMYFSFWPERYEPKEENRYISQWNWNNYPSETSWPSDVESPDGFSIYGHIWSYQKYSMNSGDFAIINDGADSWFLEYQDQIEDAITLSTFTEE